MPAPYPGRMSRLRVLLTLLALSPAAGAAAVWVGGDLTTQGFGVHAGVAVLPLPLVGTLGLEGGLTRPYRGGTAVTSLGATLRDLNLPLTNTDAFVGAGFRFTSRADLYGEAGIRTPLIGPAGLRWSVRAYPGAGEFQAGIGLEARF